VPLLLSPPLSPPLLSLSPLLLLSPPLLPLPLSWDRRCLKLCALTHACVKRRRVPVRRGGGVLRAQRQQARWNREMGAKVLAFWYPNRARGAVPDEDGWVPSDGTPNRPLPAGEWASWASAQLPLRIQILGGGHLGRRGCGAGAVAPSPPAPSATGSAVAFHVGVFVYNPASHGAQERGCNADGDA
jgi:hypothetical protein